jgi:hypothetical protein
MSRQVIQPTHERRLQSLLAGLERELLQASDEEVRQAAADLRMDPDMKGSIAWLGIFFPAKGRLEDVFDMEAFRRQFRHRLKPTERPE